MQCCFLPLIRTFLFIMLAGSICTVAVASPGPVAAAAAGAGSTVFGSTMQVNQSPSDAGLPDKLKSGSMGVGDFLLMEGIIAGISLVAAQKPNTFGGLLLAGTLLSGVDMGNDRESLLAMVLFSLVAAYNISVNDDDYEKEEVFTNNFVLWNLALGTMHLYAEAGSNINRSSRASNSQTALTLQSKPDGIGVVLHYRF